MSDRTIDHALLSTMRYAAVFRCAVAVADLDQYLICSTPIPKRAIARRLRALIDQGRCVRHRGFVTETRYAHFLGSAERRWSESEKKSALFSQSSRWLWWVPTIVGVGLTGSVAAHSAVNTDDIDVIIICHTGTLWVTRLLVLTLVFFFGKLRTRWSRDVEDHWCLNLWLDTAALPLRVQTLYTARELVQIQWVVEKQHIAESFRFQNAWLRQWYANQKIPDQLDVQKERFFWVFPLEWLAYQLQRLHMRGTRGREVVTPHSAFFHPRDTNSQVMRKYTHICSSTPHTSSH